MHNTYLYHIREFRSMPTLLIAFFGSSHADDVVVVAVNCFSKMMMAAGAESPAVATQSAKTDILQKIEEQRGTSNNHELREQDIHEEEDEDLVEENIVDKEQEAKTPPSSPPHSMPSNDKMSKEVCFS